MHDRRMEPGDERPTRSNAKNFEPDEYAIMESLLERELDSDRRWFLRRLLQQFRPWCGMPVPNTDGMMTPPKSCDLPNGHDGECKPRT